MAISQEDMIKAIEEMTVLEVSELVKALEEKFGVSASAPMMAMPAGAAAGADAEAEEQSEFDVILKDVGDSKIKVIKEVRAITGLGLKEAKALVDEAPKAIKEAVDKDEAEELKKRLSDVGATIELK